MSGVCRATQQLRAETRDRGSNRAAWSMLEQPSHLEHLEEVLLVITAERHLLGVGRQRGRRLDQALQLVAKKHTDGNAAG